MSKIYVVWWTSQYGDEQGLDNMVFSNEQDARDRCDKMNAVNEQYDMKYYYSEREVM